MDLTGEDSFEVINAEGGEMDSTEYDFSPESRPQRTKAKIDLVHNVSHQFCQLCLRVPIIITSRLLCAQSNIYHI